MPQTKTGFTKPTEEKFDIVIDFISQNSKPVKLHEIKKNIFEILTEKGQTEAAFKFIGNSNFMKKCMDYSVMTKQKRGGQIIHPSKNLYGWKKEDFMELSEDEIKKRMGANTTAMAKLMDEWEGLSVALEAKKTKQPSLIS
jgi:hypothetical protein